MNRSYHNSLDLDVEWNGVYASRCLKLAEKNPAHVRSWIDFIKLDTLVKEGSVSSIALRRVSRSCFPEPGKVLYVEDECSSAAKLVVDMLHMPLEDIPLYLGSKVRIIVDTAHWRLGIGE